MPVHEAALKACIQEMRKILKAYRVEYADPETLDVTGRQAMLDWYALRRRGCTRIADQLLKHPAFQAKFTKQTLVNEMSHISEALLATTNIIPEDAMTRAIECLETSQLEWRSVYPLSGISLYDVDELPLGSTTIRLMTDEFISSWIDEMETTLSRDESLTEEDRETLRENWRVVLGTFRRDQVTAGTTPSERRQARVYADVRVIGDIDRAGEIAETKVRRVIDILRYACIPLQTFDFNTTRYIGLEGEFGQGPRVVETIPSTYIGHGTTFSSGHINPLLLDRKGADVLAEWGVLDLGALLDYRDSEYILDAVHWFAESLTQSESGHAFLCLAVGLETLFANDRSKAWEPVAHGVACIIGGDGKKTVSTMQRMYEVRNDVAHGRKRHVWRSRPGIDAPDCAAGRT